MIAQARVQQGVPTGGRFAPMTLPESDVTLDDTERPGAGVISVKDSSGDTVDLTPGIIDDDARWAYTHGQCLALAVAVSRRTGWPMRVCTYTEQEPDSWEPSGYRENKLLRHATVLTPTGDALDINGTHDLLALEQVEADEDVEVEIVAADEADRLLEEHEGFLEEQDIVAAETFVQSVLDLNE